MTRNEFINHLIEQDCYPDEDCNSVVSQLWRNGINGEMCYVPCEEDLTIPTWCHIVRELKIDPPLQYDADYHVFQAFQNSLNSKTDA